jgi:uncharacterized protein (TIGR02145 family)
MKSMGTTYWNTPNTDATNSSSFSAFPGGYRDGRSGGFNNKGNFSHNWSSTAVGDGSAYLRTLKYDAASVERADWNKKDGVSVRCLKD